MNVLVNVGKDEVVVFDVQIYDDWIVVMSELVNVKGFVVILVDLEDFELVDIIVGKLVLEVWQDDDIKYMVRVGLFEIIDMKLVGKQETFGLYIDELVEAVRIMVDGKVGTIEGKLGLDKLKFMIFYQWIVDFFYDDEGKNVNVCMINENGEEECKDEWQEVLDVLEVDGMFIVSVLNILGILSYDVKDDVFKFVDMSLGEFFIILVIDDDVMLMVDMNVKDGYVMSVNFGGKMFEIFVVQFVFKFDIQVVVGDWEQMSLVIEDMFELKKGETMGIRMDGLDIFMLIVDMIDEDDIQFWVFLGTLMLWSSEMIKDVVIIEGMCIDSKDDDEMIDEEKNVKYDMFGGLFGGICGS